MPFDPETLGTFSFLGVGLVFLGGLLTSLGPCNVATIPLIVGYVGGSHDISRFRAFMLSFAFAFGLALTFMALGVAAALIGGVIGLRMLGAIRLRLPMIFGDLRERIELKGIPGALVLGLVSGLVASQCATPVLVAILTYVMAKGALLYGAALLFVYALGRGVPVVLVGTFTGALKSFSHMGVWSGVIEKVSGVIVIGVGLYFLWIA